MAPLPSTPELDELIITIVVDNATDTLSSIGPGIPQLPEIACRRPPFGACPMSVADASGPPTGISKPLLVRAATT
jgi:hypothetical protein